MTQNTIIITGASRGIGEATARHLGALGNHVILAARTASDIERIAKEIKENGGHASAFRCDVSEYAQVSSLVDFALEQTGRLDVVVNNAGTIEPIARLTDSNPDTWSTIVDVNYKSVYYALHSAIPVMSKQEGSGTIINISSGAATSALEGWSHYCSTKAAVLSLTKCADKEYRDQGIRVIGLSPGTVATDMMQAIKASGVNPVSQMEWSQHIPAQWVAQAIAFLCTSDADEFRGMDFSLKNNDGRQKAGLPLIA